MTLKPDLIYFIAAEDRVKIGRSIDPNKRLRELQTASPFPLRMLGFFEGGELEEKETQRRFRTHSLHGEWFKLTPEVLAFIRAHTENPVLEETSEVPIFSSQDPSDQAIMTRFDRAFNALIDKIDRECEDMRRQREERDLRSSQLLEHAQRCLYTTELDLCYKRLKGITETR